MCFKDPLCGFGLLPVLCFITDIYPEIAFWSHWFQLILERHNKLLRYFQIFDISSLLLTH